MGGHANPGCHQHRGEANGAFASYEHRLPELRRARLPQSLPFEKVQHKVTTLDAQPSSPASASILVSVTGLLVVRTDLPVDLLYPLIKILP